MVSYDELWKMNLSESMERLHNERYVCYNEKAR